MEGEASNFLFGLACLVAFFLFACWLGRFLQPKCISCSRGRMKTVDQWRGNQKLKCDKCDAEYWDLEI